LQIAATKRRACKDPDGKHVHASAVHGGMNSTINPLSRHASPRTSSWGPARVALGAAVVVALLGGCGRRPIVVQAPPATVIQQPAPTQIVTAAPTAPSVVVMREAPPPPRHEPMTPQPASDYVWIPGYWAWRNGQQMWVVGHWEVPPHTGARWVSPRWERQGDGYIFVQGYWQ
jgi:hypothetical protein